MNRLASLHPGMRFWPLALFVLICLVLWADHAGLLVHGAGGRDASVQDVKADCPNPASGCSLQVNGRTLRFGMLGDAKPLAPFDIWVATADASGQAIGKVEARFTMEGMDMGFNLYTLRPDSKGVFRATVTLPICVTGRRDWNMILDIDHIRLTVPFVTNL